MTEASKTHYNEVEKIWYGRKTGRIFSNKYSIGSVIFESLKKDPDHIRQVSFTSGLQLTNREILLSAIRVAQNLEHLNMELGEIVGICASNTDYLSSLVFGCFFNGLVISTLDPSFDKDGIKHIYSITKPKLMFCDGAIYDKVKKAFEESDLNSTVIYTINEHREGVPKLSDLLSPTQREEEFECVDLKMGPSQLAAILCSSGTTGLPKGVSLTHIALSNLLGKIAGSSDTERFLCFSTIYWLSGLFGLIISPFSKFTRIISANPFKPEDFIEINKQFKPTFFFGTPNQIGQLLAHPYLDPNTLKSLRVLFLGGSTVPYKLVEKIKRYVPEAIVFTTYGQIETCGGVTNGLAIEDGNVGQLVPNIEVKIINDGNKNLGPGEVGEICSRTYFHWPGYYGNPKATNDIYDSERWIHSGDLGYFNEKGDLYVIDRKKDILKYNNYHFSPSEIEAVILELSDVVEGCVFGVPDIVFTFLPAAAIVKLTGSSLTGKEVYEHVKERMTHFKQLRGGVYFVNELPKTPSGKILRRNMIEVCKSLNNEL
ncbi:hypothetical protein DOY81_005202 [Sarcophaga bullata]|nr:hypothetical protein DOY81_005202 [Sarcophaga bullata]